MAKLSYKKGARVSVNGRNGAILSTSGVDEVLVGFDDGVTEEINVSELAPTKSKEEAKKKPLDALSNKEFEIARRRRAIIDPILKTTGSRGKIVKQQAELHGLSISTIYRYLQAYEKDGYLSDLACQYGKKRKKRLDSRVEAIIQNKIESLCLKIKQASVQVVFEAVNRACKMARLKTPNINTVRSRVKEISPEKRTRLRRGSKAARDKYGPAPGIFPKGDYPLQCVQIDHTKLDIFIVDDELRRSIERPWLTLAIDSYSRMIVGFYLSLEQPSAFSVGMCITQAILQKDQLLAQYGIKEKWPVWGLPRTIHADNGKDFRSLTIQKSCEEHDISLEWRRLKIPEDGGRVERMMGTVAKEMRRLDGTTFSNVHEKGIYDSEGQATKTLKDMEEYLIKWIVNVYHKSLHRGIHTSPFAKWKEGIEGTNGQRGTGLPEPIRDPEKLRLDFLPYTERTVQRTGIIWDNITYHSDVLRPWINEEKGGKKMKFIVRRDPRDISKIIFLDPELKEYFQIPYRNISNPSISIWEHREALRLLKERGKKNISEEELFEAREELLELEEICKKKTKKTRRKEQRRKGWRETASPKDTATPAETGKKTSTRSMEVPEEEDEEIFDVPEAHSPPLHEDWI